MLDRLTKNNNHVIQNHIQQARSEMQQLNLDTTAQRHTIETFTQNKTKRDNLHRPLQRQRQHADAMLRTY